MYVKTHKSEKVFFFYSVQLKFYVYFFKFMAYLQITLLNEFLLEGAS